MTVVVATGHGFSASLPLLMPFDTRTAIQCSQRAKVQLASNFIVTRCSE